MNLTAEKDKHMILRSIDRITENKSRFSIVERDKKYESTDISGLVSESCKQLNRFQRGLCFFPLSADATGIALFLSMLKLGFQPIVISPSAPANQITDLMSLYKDIPLYRNSTFIDLSGCQCSPAIVNPDFFIGLTTSGSTGRPKIIIAGESSLSCSIKAITEAQELDCITSTSVVLPLHYSYPLINQLLWALTSEKKLILTGGLAKAGETIKIIQKENSDMVCMVGQQVRAIRALGLSGGSFVLPSVRLVNFAGGVFPHDCFSTLKDLFPNARLLNNYGCTEALPRVAVGTARDSQDPAFIGPVISGLEIKVLDRRNKNILSSGRPDRRTRFGFMRGKTGLVYIKGDSTSCGLLSPDGKTVIHSSDGWLPTGDVGYLDREGNLHILGRNDQIFNSGGERISLMSIENALRKCEGIHDAVSTAVKEDNGEQWPLACITGRKLPSRNELKDLLIKNLIKAAWPKKIIFFKKWPLLENGKPDRKKIINSAMTCKMNAVWSMR